MLPVIDSKIEVPEDLFWSYYRLFRTLENLDPAASEKLPKPVLEALSTVQRESVATER